MRVSSDHQSKSKPHRCISKSQEKEGPNQQNYRPWSSEFFWGSITQYRISKELTATLHSKKQGRETIVKKIERKKCIFCNDIMYSPKINHENKINQSL